MSKLLTIMVAAALVPASAATGQQAGPPAPVAAPDPAAVEAARALLVSGGFQEQLRAGAIQSSDALFTALLQQVETRHQIDLPARLEAELRRIVIEHVERTAEETGAEQLDRSARLYAQHFTAEELRELQRLQSHPVMVKFQTVMPQFMREMMQIGLDLAAARAPALNQRIDAAFQDWMEEMRRDSRPPA